MVRLMILLGLVVLCVHVSLADNKYCQIQSCNKRAHTACKFAAETKPSAKCQKIIQAGLTKEEKQKIIDLHNEYRQKVASGNEKRGRPGPQPAAKSMPKVEWDDELATIAQKWADQCTFGHDSCRNVQRFSVGQNIASTGTTGDPNSLKVEALVNMWYDEVRNFNKNDVSHFSVGSQDIGHYTQLVWAKSTKIGCGAVKYNDGKFNQFYLVCNYGPAGNVIGEPIYEVK